LSVFWALLSLSCVYKVAETRFFFFRERGIHLIYLEDILIFNQSSSNLLKDSKLVLKVLEFLDFVINFEKSALTLANNWSISVSLSTGFFFHFLCLWAKMTLFPNSVWISLGRTSLGE
jgi:hypothetical protein